MKLSYWILIGVVAFWFGWFVAEIVKSAEPITELSCPADTAIAWFEWEER